MERRTLNLPDLDAVIAEARSLHETGYEQAGNWDLTQICRHCVVAISSSMDGFAFGLPLPLRVMIRVMGMKKKFFRTRFVKAGIPAPQDVVFPSADGDRELEAEAVDELIAVIERFKTHRGSLYPNPGFGELSRDEWDEFHIIHTMHHLSFLIPAVPAAAMT